MIEAEVREIDGIEFRVSGLDLRTERKVFVRLTKLLGPALAQLASQGREASGAAAKAFIEELEEDDVEFLCKTFMTVTQFQFGEGKWIPIADAQFTQGFSSQMKWLWFCLEHQYGAFLGGGSKKLSDLIADFGAKASASTSPKA